MKQPYKVKFYIWLIDTLSRKPMTYIEIEDAWVISSANEDMKPLTKRSFDRYKNEASMMFDLDFECKAADGYRYKVVRPNDAKKGGALDWMVSAFRISNLASKISKRNFISLEAAPSGSELLSVVIDAIDKKYSLSFTYQTYFKPAKEVSLIPAFVKLYKQRWYVIGQLNKGEEKERTYAFEKISNVRLIEEKSYLSQKMEEWLTPNNYFKDCFGIINRFEPLLIRIRAFAPQDKYIASVPIHASQKLVYECKDYSDFELYVKPTYDFKQELMWHRDNIAVLSPEPFRLEMIEMIEATLQGYKTGECYKIDE